MPIAKVQLPDGRIGRFEVPEGTTPDQVLQFAQQNQASFGGQDAAPTGVPSAAPNAQIQDSGNAGGFNAPADSGTGIQDVLAGGGNALLEIVAGVNRAVAAGIDIPGDIVNAVSQLSGSEFRVPSVTDIPVPFTGGQTLASGTEGGFVEDPNIRQVLGMAGEFLAPAPPIAALARRGDDLPKLSDDLTSLLTKPSVEKQKLARELTSDPSNIDLVKVIKDSAGGIKRDPLAIETIKQGFKEGIIATIKGSKPRDRRRMQEMVKILKGGRKNELFGARNRPTDIAGKSLIKRVDQVKRINREAGTQIDKVAQTLKGKPVDIAVPVNTFSETLQDFGVRLVDDGKGGFKPDFTDSALAPGDRGPLKEIIRQMSRIGRRGDPDALGAHELKRIIDRNVTFGKTKTGLGGDAERALKEFRVGLDDVLDSNFPVYNKVNKAYSDTIGALDSLKTAVGPSVDLFGPNADKAIGTSLRGLLSNNKSRVALIDSIDTLEGVAKSTEGGLGFVKRIGVKPETAFDDDVLAQILFADELDRMFGAVARTSLKGQVSQAAETGAQVARRGLGDVAVDVGIAGIEKARGINEKNAIKSIEQLLRRNQ